MCNLISLNHIHKYIYKYFTCLYIVTNFYKLVGTVLIFGIVHIINLQTALYITSC